MSKDNRDYDAIVLEEGGYIVEFSNRGVKPKIDSVRLRYHNPGRGRIKCGHPGCSETTTAESGLCGKHRKGEDLHPRHEKDWLGRVIPSGYLREKCITDAPEHRIIADALLRWAGDDESRLKKLDSFVKDVLDKIVGEIPDATSLQQAFDGRLSGVMTPDDVVELTKKLVDGHFSKEEYGDVVLDGGVCFRKRWKDISLRVVTALLVLAFASEEANQGDWWYRKKCFGTGTSKGKPNRAGCYMSAGWYLYKRHTKEKFHHLIRRSLQGKG